MNENFFTMLNNFANKNIKANQNVAELQFDEKKPK